jgi:hypothetical protein
MLCSSQDHLETGTRDLDHPVLTGAKNTNKSLTTLAPGRKIFKKVPKFYLPDFKINKL